MDINKKVAHHAPTIEKVIIIMIFFTVLLNYIISDTDFSTILIILQLGLIVLYMLQLHVRLYALLWAGFILGIISYFFAGSIHPLLFYFFNSIGYVVFGLIVLIRAVGDSIKHKN